MKSAARGRQRSSSLSQGGQRIAERSGRIDRAHRVKQPFNDGQLGLTLGGARLDDRARLGRGPRTLLDEERFQTCPLAVELGRTLPFDRNRVVHLFSQPRRRVRCGLFQLGAQARRGICGRLLQFGAELGDGRGRALLDFSPHALGRLRGRVLDLATNAIGLRDDAAIGIGRRIGQTSLKPALPLVADGLDTFAVTLLGFGRGFHEVLDLEPCPLRLGRKASLGFGRRIGKSGLEPSVAIPGGPPRPC